MARNSLRLYQLRRIFRLKRRAFKGRAADASWKHLQGRTRPMGRFEVWRETAMNYAGARKFRRGANSPSDGVREFRLNFFRFLARRVSEKSRR
jgi:hypothetical protein